MATVGYTPAPYEQAYYEGLFQAADVRRAGALGGQEAVAFFTRSRLQTDTLKNIWTLADQPTTNTLDRRKFFTAVRLIQLSQNGQKAQGADLAAPPGVTLRPVVFEGVSGVSVPIPQAPPPQQQQQQQQQAPMQQPMRASTPTMQQPSPAAATPPSPNRYGQMPPTPPRPPMAQSQPPVMSTALTAQDPYSMPPQEQARYEDLFSQYAKEDGYVYGAEAVGLFSKSGLPQDTLRDIWNMVDTPVDNRLDKLEFAMAMHLIVCVSKKNLPLPQGLPISLKGLKSQQPGAPGASAPSPAMNAPPQQQQMAGSAASVGSGMGAPQMMGSSMSVGSGPPQLHDTPPAEIHAAPPLRPAGGMGISDAFEGLSGAGGGDMSGPPPITASSLPDPGSFASAPSASSFDQTPAVSTIPDPEPVAAPAPPPAPAMEKPKTSKELASSYEMGDNHAELEKLKTMLQKLQAENISLKASLGSMTEEEKEVQKEIGATVAEIGKLSNELTGLRAQVLSAKSALLQATAELKGHKEKKEMITDLISETKATKEAIDSALDGVHEAEKMNEQAQMHPAPPSYEADLFGGFDVPAPAPATDSFHNQQGSSHPMAPPISTVSTPEEEVNATQGMAQAPAETFNPEPAQAKGVETVMSSDDEGGVMGAPPPPANDAPISMFNASPAVPHKTTSDVNPGLTATPSAAEVEDIKAAASKAEQTAREAEETRRSLAQQADDLRQVAEQAESEVREKEAHTGQKRNPLRVGGKRKEMKQIEQAKQDAAEKKQQYMDMQAQANNAQALALETRREADRLNQEAEQKEIEAAQAASLAQTTQPVEQTQMPMQQTHMPMQQTQMPAPAMGAPNGGGFAFPQHRKEPSDYGGFGGGFGIMGGTTGDNAWSIPSPGGSQNGDAAHPF